jgi:glycosyltransferase involved in cell wall biosynthesis
MRVAYLVSRYPIVSHAFIVGEVQALRERGVEVQPFTVVRVDRDELIEDATHAEDARTTALRPVSPPRLAAVHLGALLRRPRGYAAALARALRLRSGGARDLVWQLAYFAQAVLLATELRRRRIRHVHAHHANVASDVAMLACTYDRRLSWSLTLHGPTELADVARHRLAVKVADAALVACISDFARSQAMALLPPDAWARLRVVHLGVDLEAFGGDRHRGTPAGGERTLRVLSVGRLSAQKGHPVLLEAVAAARERGADVQLTLVGDGPLRDELRRLAGALGLDGAVTLPGAIGHDRLAELYQQADAFCLASFAEGVPVVLMEAMASGLPVIATRVMGVPELVEDGVSGLLVPPGRADLIADALVRLAAAGPEHRSEMGRAGREAVRREWSLADSAAAMHQLLADAAGGV